MKTENNSSKGTPVNTDPGEKPQQKTQGDKSPVSDSPAGNSPGATSKEVTEVPKETDIYQELVTNFDEEARPKLEKLIEHLKVYASSQEDEELVRKAFALTINMHGTQKRASG